MYLTKIVDDLKIELEKLIKDIDKSVEDIKNWHSFYMPKLKGETLLKIMTTMKQRYDIHFIICPKKQMGEMIIKLLNCNKE